MDEDEYDARDAELLRRLAQVPLELTERQLRAVAYLSHGLTPDMAAVALQVTQHTFRDELDNVRIKLHAKTTLHACCIALRLGLLD